MDVIVLQLAATAFNPFYYNFISVPGRGAFTLQEGLQVLDILGILEWIRLVEPDIQ